ncbi:uncharacterized protein LOC129715076 isoform X4 [Leucoraja erinacea]|uniref:uncharacterized protein LOC129715076 isoform X4 n=1 Tax=Leucoraja erinaceus TaxID=7782 RepID=UPI002457CCDB|nr:uncharacterized protein LOC129715076 isoform X4 [Leucoraja erinacea]
MDEEGDLPLRVTSAALRSVVSGRHAEHYGRVVDFVDVVWQQTSSLITYRHYLKLTLAFKAKLVMEMFVRQCSLLDILQTLDKYFPPTVFSQSPGVQDGGGEGAAVSAAVPPPGSAAGTRRGLTVTISCRAMWSRSLVPCSWPLPRHCSGSSWRGSRTSCRPSALSRPGPVPWTQAASPRTSNPLPIAAGPFLTASSTHRSSSGSSTGAGTMEAPASRSRSRSAEWRRRVASAWRPR